MGRLKRYLSWYWTHGRRVASSVHRLSDAIAGVLFILVVPLGLSSAEAWFQVEVPIVPTANATTIWLFVTVTALFAVFAILETVAGIFTFTFGALKRVFIR
jgi:hypothetical protein